MDEILTPNPDDDPKIPPPPSPKTFWMIGAISASLIGVLALGAGALVAMDQLQRGFIPPPEYAPDIQMMFVQMFVILIMLICLSLLGYMARLWVQLRKAKKASESDTSILGRGSVTGDNPRDTDLEPERTTP